MFSKYGSSSGLDLLVSWHTQSFNTSLFSSECTTGKMWSKPTGSICYHYLSRWVSSILIYISIYITWTATRAFHPLPLSGGPSTVLCRVLPSPDVITYLHRGLCTCHPELPLLAPMPTGFIGQSEAVFTLCFIVDKCLVWLNIIACQSLQQFVRVWFMWHGNVRSHTPLPI